MVENTLAGLHRKNLKYAEPAYVFVLTALHSRLARLPEPRHVSGAEVAAAVRDLALERFGPLARTVLEHWGVHTTCDMGEVVFALVDYGILIKQRPGKCFPVIDSHSRVKPRLYALDRDRARNQIRPTRIESIDQRLCWFE